MTTTTITHPRYIPADSRYISRVIKAAGFHRAENNFDNGFRVDVGSHGGAQVHAWYGVTDHGRDLAKASLGRIQKALEAKGFRLDASLNVYRPVKQGSDLDDFFFWQESWPMHGSNHACRVMVEIDGALVPADQVPEYKAEREAREARFQANLARQRAEAKAEKARQDLVKLQITQALEEKGINWRPSGSTVEGSTSLVISFKDLANLLGIDS